MREALHKANDTFKSFLNGLDTSVDQKDPKEGEDPCKLLHKQHTAKDEDGTQANGADDAPRQHL